MSTACAGALVLCAMTVACRARILRAARVCAAPLGLMFFFTATQAFRPGLTHFAPTGAREWVF